ncbi:MAG: aminoacyl-tRNA hydrolase [Firmicutes bacterium]|nr:aminoacyl-tRNA hydrolase [Bacillota bacterium]MCL2771434.1 aminoacyl-tRNA hydrolase [Bacillota bacterium]
MKLIVGLGNIGLQYDKTFHNAGFLALDFFMKKHGLTMDKKTSVGMTTKAKVLGQDVMFLKPSTFMNLSGNAVVHFSRKFKIEPKDILVVFDDIDLPLGEVRWREKGSGGTHNGMRDICQKLGSKDFPRVKIGIETRTSEEKLKFKLSSYVLKKLPKEVLDGMNKEFEVAAGMIEDWLRG